MSDEDAIGSDGIANRKRFVMAVAACRLLARICHVVSTFVRRRRAMTKANAKML
ncbi:MAG: hypothetical protein LBD68_06790 [Zoogloeaceae bacterium]|jgi:hypothetical protein|nr:hypothetical protein [Zoogloeaceae bacterium]